MERPPFSSSRIPGRRRLDGSREPPLSWEAGLAALLHRHLRKHGLGSSVLHRDAARQFIVLRQALRKTGLSLDDARQQIDTTLSWYVRQLGLLEDLYLPVALSALTFRRKYPRIHQAMLRLEGAAISREATELRGRLLEALEASGVVPRLPDPAQDAREVQRLLDTHGPAIVRPALSWYARMVEEQTLDQHKLPRVTSGQQLAARFDWILSAYRRHQQVDDNVW